MLRQPSSRNQRTRGFRLKHALQIGILLAVCIWLLYQVKHSHDKKRAYDARNSKIISKSVENQEDFFKFGRKDLTGTGEAGAADDIHKEEESEEAQEEEVTEIKQEETEDEEMRGAGDGGRDEQNQENVDEETERGEEDSTEEEEGKEGDMEEPDLFDSRDHGEGTQAREENYKRDDASSAVVHEAQAAESDTVKEDARSTDEGHVVADSSKGDNNSTGDGTKVDAAGEMLAENAVNGTVDGSVNDLSVGVKDNSTMLIDNNPANNGTAAENKEPEAGTSNPDNAPVTDSTATSTADDFDNRMQLSANSTASVSENQTEGQNSSTVVEVPAEVQVPKDTVAAADSAQDRNATVVDKGTPAEGESSSNSTATVDSRGQSATPSATNGTVDAGAGETGHGSTHAVSEEERDARADPSTLPDIRNEARTMDGGGGAAAAE